MKNDLLIECLVVGAVAVALAGTAGYYIGYDHGHRASPIHGPHAVVYHGNLPTNNPSMTHGQSNHFGVGFWSNNSVGSKLNAEQWCNYTYGQGVTNGVVEAVSTMNRLTVRVAAGEKLTQGDMMSAVFGSITNAMSKNKYQYYDANNSQP